MNTRLLGILAIGVPLRHRPPRGARLRRDDAPDPAATAHAPSTATSRTTRSSSCPQPDRIKSAVAGGSMIAHLGDARARRARRVPRLHPRGRAAPLRREPADPRDRGLVAAAPHVLGVFGPGEAYERTVNALKSDANPERRANAADALGEFLAVPGIEACKAAIENDKDARVRAAAASALGRLNRRRPGRALEGHDRR
jgi:hypothetical protein